jgi:chitinase
MKNLIFTIACCLFFFKAFTQNQKVVMAYYAGNHEQFQKYPVEKLTHIIYSFLRLNGNRLFINPDRNDDLNLKTLVDLKQKHPNLKVIVAFGGWAGCETCSDIFSSEKNRVAFAKSVKKILEVYDLDGIDLDWEYPAIQGEIGHGFKPEDKQNFTALIQELRNQLGEKYEISFAAGISDEFREQSVEWEKVMPIINHVNLMTYDIVHGGSNFTGHHTNLWSTPQQQLSVDYGVKKLLEIGVPANKIVIGAAFYARVFSAKSSENNGLYQKGSPQGDFVYKNFTLETEGYEIFWDEIAQAPYGYHSKKGTFITFDNDKSVALKAQYVEKNQLKGIMFWELTQDKLSNGLLDSIYQNIQK